MSRYTFLPEKEEGYRDFFYALFPDDLMYVDRVFSDRADL